MQPFGLISCLQLRSQNEIIVMELCSGGSLFTLLENPANAYGFTEDDFKQVVKDVGKDSVTLIRASLRRQHPWSSGLNKWGYVRFHCDLVRNRKHAPCFQVEVWENKCYKNTN